METTFEQTIKMLIDEMNFMMSTRNYDADMGEQDFMGRMMIVFFYLCIILISLDIGHYYYIYI